MLRESESLGQMQNTAKEHYSDNKGIIIVELSVSYDKTEILWDISKVKETKLATIKIAFSTEEDYFNATSIENS